MTDEADIANDYAEFHLEHAIKAALGIPSPSQDNIKESANECIECSDLIPSQRQKAIPGCQLCVACAEDIERRK